MEKKDNKLTRSEYLEIKRKAKADREICQKEIDKSPENIDILLDAFSSSYEGEARLTYRANFLIPNDSEFRDFYISHGKSTNACIKHFTGTELGDILTKIMSVERYGICDDLELEEPEKLEYEEENIGESTSNPLEEKLGDAISRSIQSALDENRAMFSPLERLDMGESEFTDKPEEKLADRKPANDNEVEKQTEEALEKINHLFESHDTKDEIIKKQSDEIESLQKQNETVKDENSKLHEEIDNLNVKMIGLEEENRALREQYQRIIDAIDQKYGEYSENHGKRI